MESILKKRIKKGKIEYFVRWKYYNDTTWEPEENLQNVLQMIEEFEKKVNPRATVIFLFLINHRPCHLCYCN